ncbi:three-Cys-motif partner protein TcmP [Alicyclobacillus pomorum]|uniref:three-Cys-motif partner protein TcmP n=1 Tax=Alicyclobacillus pomorum TaxID=204470 RepID=UPI0004266992|nr:three-Cys-motif partner protein TcmP [Alicyclobacillus pomorum]
MNDNLPTIWTLEPHTLAKHIILRNYLRAWFPIMGKWNQRILFIDGYAGPGVYDQGEDGSPVIVLKEAMNYLDACTKNNWPKPEIVCLFIEQDGDRFASLTQTIAQMKIPQQISVKTMNSTFEVATSNILDFLESKGSNLAPAFVFIDPFGYTLPFSLIQRLMKHPKCEVFINFMYEFVNRFITRAGQEQVMTMLFGCDDWRTLNLKSLDPSARRQAIHDLYQKQLEQHAARYVRSFEMKGFKNTTKYFLFYGTNHKKGLEKMKDAMWRVDTGGAYTFSDATDPSQAVLFSNEPDYAYLKQLIVNKFSGQTVTIEEIEDFVLCETPFLSTHFKRQILNPMEKGNELKVVNSSRKKTGSFPPGTIMAFS